MAAWSRDNQLVEHHRWTLRLPADIQDMYETLSAAQHSRDQCSRQEHPSSVKVISGTETEDGDLMIVYYTLTRGRKDLHP